MADLRKVGEDKRTVTPPLSELQIAQRLPTLGITLGQQRPHVRGKIREYISL